MQQYRAGTPRTARWVVFVDIAIAGAMLLGTASAFAGTGSVTKLAVQEFGPILLLLGAVAFLVWRLPKVEEDYTGQLAHLTNSAYRLRRAVNWLVLGATYAFLYWGRYNLNPALTVIGGKDLVTNFNFIFGVGTMVYGLSFLVNGPLTDRLGGRFSILMSSCGACVANACMGITCWAYARGTLTDDALFWVFLPCYALNMYFQSFGAVAIVKCNAAWFHVRERGVFGAIFGILISLGVYFAYDWSDILITDRGWHLPVQWAFIAPAIALAIAFLCNAFIVRNRPSEAGYADFATDDATSGDTEQPDPPRKVFAMMLRDPVIMTIASIEFCSGFLRQAIMQGYRLYEKCIGGTHLFVYVHWGMLLCIAGILGGVFAGTVSDRVFKSRRGPVAVVLYGGMLLGSFGIFALLGSPLLGWCAVCMSLCVMGVHGMLSGTASMDFGGTKNAGIAVGIIDGFVYLGSSLQGYVYGLFLPKGPGAPGADNPSNWWLWPLMMVPFAIIGLVLSYRIRHETPKKAAPTP